MKIRYIKKEENSSNIISIDDFFDFLKERKIITETKCRIYKWDVKQLCVADLHKSLKKGEIFLTPLIIIDNNNFFSVWMQFYTNVKKVVDKNEKLKNNTTYIKLILAVDNQLRDGDGFDISDDFIKTTLKEEIDSLPKV